MQKGLTKIWNRVAVAISYDRKHNTTSDSSFWYNVIYIYIDVCVLGTSGDIFWPLNFKFSL